MRLPHQEYPPGVDPSVCMMRSCGRWPNEVMYTENICPLDPGNKKNGKGKGLEQEGPGYYSSAHQDFCRITPPTVLFLVHLSVLCSDTMFPRCCSLIPECRPIFWLLLEACGSRHLIGDPALSWNTCGEARDPYCICCWPEFLRHPESALLICTLTLLLSSLKCEGERIPQKW